MRHLLRRQRDCLTRSACDTNISVFDLRWRSGESTLHFIEPFDGFVSESHGLYEGRNEDDALGISNTNTLAVFLARSHIDVRIKYNIKTIALIYKAPEALYQSGSKRTHLLILRKQPKKNSDLSVIM